MKGLLKFITCGSVDDGKSTLIGHILYDSKLIYADQEKALILDSKVGSREGAIDYSLLLDGLMAEREQGITIDVAYRYFTTEKRSFIVADTPGHEEYTRNMAVGASFADLSIILIDATQGLLPQTRRHARICKLMGIQHYVFAVNKMDLASYDEDTFREIENNLKKLSEELELGDYVTIPVSATEGDNVTRRSDNMPWYQGVNILEHLETVDVSSSVDEKGFYMPIQRVCRPNHHFRGFQGQIEAGSISVGDEITIYPSKETANIKGILIGDKKSDSAVKGQAVTISLDKEVDVSRGCVIAKEADLQLSSEIIVNILWMNDEPLDIGHNFLVKVGTRLIPGAITEIKYKVDINTGEHKETDELKKNELSVCTVKLADTIVVDKFSTHKTLGELILIDRVSNMTSACGVIIDIVKAEESDIRRVNRDIRARMNMQTSYIFEFRLNHGDGQGADVDIETIHKVEKELVLRQRHTYLYHPSKGDSVIEVISHLQRAGIVVLFAREDNVSVDGIEDILTKDTYITGWMEESGDSVNDIADYIYKKTKIVTEVEDGGYI